MIELGPGADKNPFTGILAKLLRQNLDDHDSKQVDFAKLDGRVAIVIVDMASSITLHFQRGRLTVHNGIVGIPDITMRAGYEHVMQMSLMEIGRFGLPDPKGENTKEILDASKDGRIQTFGAVFNIPLMLRLTRVMSVN